MKLYYLLNMLLIVIIHNACPLTQLRLISFRDFTAHKHDDKGSAESLRCINCGRL